MKVPPAIAMLANYTAPSIRPCRNARHSGRQIVVWLFAEVMLNLVGLDDLADYSEYVFKAEAVQSQPTITIVR